MTHVAGSLPEVHVLPVLVVRGVGLLGQPAVRLLTVLQALVGDPGHQGGVGTSGPGRGKEQQPQKCRKQRPSPSLHPGPWVSGDCVNVGWLWSP